MLIINRYYKLFTKLVLFIDFDISFLRYKFIYIYKKDLLYVFYTL